ncbi:hypothetical protein [Cohnella panacarvi]|uniref:hypothetical protein n=1 Tax=Cohnella panacarvi TaxID=400776 RepID=UPI0004787DE3|nr:hypothetical protein [Cohnella panacarvi]
MNNRYYKVMMNSLLGGAIAMGFGTTGAYADDGKANATTEQATVTISANAGSTTSDTIPVLVPGHPFYILKIFIETIEVALKTEEVTINDVSEKDVTVIDTKAASEAASKVEDNARPMEPVVFELRLKHNIEALTKALEYVKNPTARAALTRNIERSLEKAIKGGGVSEEEEVDDEQASVEARSEQTQAGKKAAREQTKAAEKAAHEQAKAAKKAAREQAKAAKKAAHEQAKAAKKAGH